MDEYVERKLEEKRKEKEEGEGAAAPDKKKDKGAVAVEIKGDPEELGLPTERGYVLVERDF